MREAGLRVTTLSLIPPADIIGNYLDQWFPEGFDCIWASHVLEHQPNPNLFLQKVFSDLKDGGILAVTVPPMKPQIVGGHLTLWNAGLLIYNLIIAGFDCSEAKIIKHGYNISVIVEKRKAELPEDLHYDRGDILKLAHFFPFPVTEGFDGNNYG